MKILEPVRKKSTLTEQSHRILEVLRANQDEWLSRKDIARGLGKRRLTPYDIELLQRLCEEGLAEIGKRPNSTPIGYEYAYQAVALEAEKCVMSRLSGDSSADD